MNDKKYGLWIALVLLTAMIAADVYFVMQHEMEVKRADIRQEQLATLLRQQQALLDNVLVNYRNAAYSTSIDRIAEQQLIATEYQLLLLELIAQQNVLVLELLATP